MCRPPLYSTIVFAVVLAGAHSTVFGQDAKSSPRPGTDLDQFRSLDPAERLKVVEKLPGAKESFRPVTRGDLTATIVERGTLDAATAVDVTCQVKARVKDGLATVVKWVIEEGTIVKKGDRLVELDDSSIRDEIAAAKVRAHGAQAAVTAAADEFRRAKRASEVVVRLSEIEVELAEADLKQPPGGEAKRVLELKVERAKLRLEQTKDEVKGRLARAEADERARAAAAELEANRVRDLETERTRCVLSAPIDGFAVFAVSQTSRFGGAGPIIALGEPVREGQKLIRIVDLSRIVVNTRVHESLIYLVRVGQAVGVRVDAFPEMAMAAKVSHVATIAAPVDWARADTKAYHVTIALDHSPAGLKPSMSAEVGIKVGERKQVLLAPTAAIVWTRAARSCFVKDGEKLVEREVAIGATDGTSVEITAGLKEGDTVLADPSGLLAPPLSGKGGARPKGPPR